MIKLRTLATKFVREEEGASLAEYGLLLAWIAVVCIAAINVRTRIISVPSYRRFTRAATGGAWEWLPW